MAKTRHLRTQNDDIGVDNRILKQIIRFIVIDQNPPNLKKVNINALIPIQTILTLFKNKPAVVDTFSHFQAMISDELTLLDFALVSNKRIAVEAILKAGADINVKRKSRSTLIIALLLKVNPDLIMLILEKGASIEADANREHETPLLCAALQDSSYQSQIMPVLLKNIPAEKKEDIIIGLGELNHSPFYKVLQKSNQTDLIDNLLNHIQSESGRAFALFFAVFFEKHAITKQLIEKGATLNYKFENSNAFELACETGNSEAIQLFITNNYPLTSKNLELAVANQHIAIAKELIEYGANPDININEKGEVIKPEDKPLARAAVLGLSTLVKLFLPKVDIKTNAVALYLATIQGHLDIVNMLLDANCDPNADYQGYTALNAAAQNGFNDIASALLAAGADVNHGKLKPINFAISRNHLDTLKILINANAELNPEDTSTRPLMIACHEGLKSIVEELVKAGAEINFVDSEDEFSPLTQACLSGKLEVVQYLLQKGADINLGTKSPLGEAIRNNQLLIFNELLKQSFPQRHFNIGLVGCISYNKNEMLLSLLKKMQAENFSPPNKMLITLITNRILSTPCDIKLTQFRLFLEYFKVDTLENVFITKLASLKGKEKKAYSDYFKIYFDACVSKRLVIPENDQQGIYELAKAFDISEQDLISVFGEKFIENNTKPVKEKKSSSENKLVISPISFFCQAEQAQSARSYLKEHGLTPEELMSTDQQEEDKKSEKEEIRTEWLWGNPEHEFNHLNPHIKVIDEAKNTYFYCPNEILTFLQTKNIDLYFKTILEQPKFGPTGITCINNLKLTVDIILGGKNYRDNPLVGEISANGVLNRLICSGVASNNRDAKGKKAILIIPTIPHKKLHTKDDKERLAQIARNQFNFSAPPTANIKTEDHSARPKR